ncbi:hypothetical protein IQ241_11745 [Romeria aff. gracilis LEGE 07310]|uniref:Uncharacterized protein n=1 Tax=Vasconcelosia minhoensis LEGE 07310 TaxID=915328 RepID=A0A8J7A6X9_9CYAN|nr:hypothetical protein [Romeria gracilis]MBE9077957.1 hypothetical protein [Romeria aff. gracilis LEGE 07310]
MISFEATALLFFCLLLLFMSTNFSCEALGGYVTHLPDFLIKSLEFPQNISNPAINTGLGIVLGNLVINIFKYRNLINDTSKVFDLVVSNQIDDLYNIQIACENIRTRLTTHARTIIGSQNDPNTTVLEPQRTAEERRGLLMDTERIKDRERTIRDDDLYKGKLDEIKLFKSSKLEVLVRYFRKLKVVLEDLRNFTSYELPNSIDEFDTFNWRLSETHRISETYRNRTNFLIARINIVICLGLMTKRIFNRFDTKAQQNLGEVYQQLLNLKSEIQDDENIYYSLLKEDFGVIQEFAKKVELSSKYQQSNTSWQRTDGGCW